MEGWTIKNGVAVFESDRYNAEVEIELDRLGFEYLNVSVEELYGEQVSEELFREKVSKFLISILTTLEKDGLLEHVLTSIDYQKSGYEKHELLKTWSNYKEAIRRQKEWEEEQRKRKSQETLKTFSEMVGSLETSDRETLKKLLNDNESK